MLKKRKKQILVHLSLAVLIMLVAQLGFFSIPPSKNNYAGKPSAGQLLVLWRQAGEPYFNSPQAVCFKQGKALSSLCQNMAVARILATRKNISLPYINSFYHYSVRF